MSVIKSTSMLLALFFFVPNYVHALATCPVQGLDNKVCPIVVNFFDEMAKHNPEFAKHWQNHHWISQAGDNYKPPIIVQEHQQLSFGEHKAHEDLAVFINTMLTRAAKKDSKFQQVMDSHNYFVMTVQAIHVALQGGADHFNRSGSPAHSLQNSRPEEVDIKLQYKYDVQVPTHDADFNKLGIFATTDHRSLSSTYIDSTSYQAGLKVNPIIVNAAPAVALTPKTTKVNTQGKTKTVQGVGAGTQLTHQTAIGGTNAINRKPPMPGDRGRVRPQVVQAPPTPTATHIAPPVVTPYKIPKPMKSAGKGNTVPAAVNAQGQTKTVPGAGAGTQLTHQTAIGGTNAINRKPPMPGDRGRVRPQVVQAPPTPTATHIAPPVVTPYKIPKPMKSAGKGNTVPAAVNAQGQTKTVLGAGAGSQLTHQTAIGGTNAINRKPPMPGDRGRVRPQVVQAPPTPPSTHIAPPVVTPNKIPKPMKSVGKFGGNVVPMAVNITPHQPPIVILKQSGSKIRPSHKSIPSPVSGISAVSGPKSATGPNHIDVQVAPKGTNKNNINNRFITGISGNQLDANSRHYMIDDDAKVWSCKISGLGYRVSRNSDGSAKSFGHVETTHIKSPQLAHIPANHAGSNKCLIAVHK